METPGAIRRRRSVPQTWKLDADDLALGQVPDLVRDTPWGMDHGSSMGVKLRIPQTDGAMTLEKDQNLIRVIVLVKVVTSSYVVHNVGNLAAC
jgi:hypothetical protein